MSNNPKSEKLTFLELIKNQFIEIPIIQRDYAQGREGKEELRKNFLYSLKEAIDGQPLELDFIYGSDKDNVLQPLDGQQRLTTLYLLHWYFAIKENKLNDELKNILSKFTYETRTSSREFCNDLINKGIEYNIEQNISEQIIDSSWFFLSWKKDPTIKSMLTMLDTIDHTFKYTTINFEKLNNISFHFIELKNFGLSDDLYIKMNARGKALTDFENFKAKFEQYIKKVIYKTNEKREEVLENGKKIVLKENWEKELSNPFESFAHKMDTLWTDLFWNYKDDTKNIIDEQILNFFRTMAVNNFALKKSSIERDEKFEYGVRILRSQDENGRLINIPISFNQYLEFGCFDKEYFESLKSVLNKISDKSGLITFLSDTTYADENKIFEGMIQNNMSYPDLVIAFAYYKYLSTEETIEVENLTSWMRIVRNLVEGSRPYLFNKANDFANALNSVNELLQHRNNIIKYFSDTKFHSISGFTKEQVDEEKNKANLILQSDDWKNAIIEIENHGYFNGQIGFLLDWCKDKNGIYNLDEFIKYAEKAKIIFGNYGLNQFDNFLFERALLATGDYLLKKGSNYSFLIDYDRDISWKRLLRDDNDKRKYLNSLFDHINVSILIQDLEKIITAFSDKNDWRYNFVKHPSIIKECGEKKFIRWNSEYDILLLKKSATFGDHKEYHSYSLFIELKESLKLKSNSYKSQNSVFEKKYFEYNDYEISFDQKTKKYKITNKNDTSLNIDFDLYDINGIKNYLISNN